MSTVRLGRARLWAESAIALMGFVLGIVTLFWRDWIEVVFHIDPDHRGGAFEWGIVGSLLLVALACGLLARHAWRRRRMHDLAAA